MIISLVVTCYRCHTSWTNGHTLVFSSSPDCFRKPPHLIGSSHYANSHRSFLVRLGDLDWWNVGQYKKVRIGTIGERKQERLDNNNTCHGITSTSSRLFLWSPKRNNRWSIISQVYFWMDIRRSTTITFPSFSCSFSRSSSYSFFIFF